MFRTKKLMAWASCLVAAVALSVSAANADEVTVYDYPTQVGLHMGTGYGTPCATGRGNPDCDGPAGEAVVAKYGPISDIYYNSNNAQFLSPVYLIFGAAYGCTVTSGPDCIPAGAAAGVNAVSSVKYYEDYTANPNPPANNYDYGSGTFMANGTSSMIAGDPFGLAGLCNQGGGFFCGNFVYAGNENNDVYELLGLPPDLDQPSLKLSNVLETIMDVEPGITAITGFSLYAYQLTPNVPYEGLTGHGMIALTFAVPPPAGSFAIAFGCSTESTTDTRTTGPRTDPTITTTITTPCEQVNRTNMLIMPPGEIPPQVPEPGSLVLLGTGLLGLGATLKRKLMS